MNPNIKNNSRKSMLYKTKVEYGDYTMNYVLGCSHGCHYPCYAYLLKKRFKHVVSYEDWITPKIVSNTLEILEIELPKLRKKIKSVHLCFTTDPFMYGYGEIEQLSLEIIKRINAEGIKCTVLTKGILPPGLSEYSKVNEYGITLISLDEEFRKKIEPGAAPYESRINALKTLHNNGCSTWVSIEPYPTPNLIKQSITDILEEIKFVDKIIFGRTNYNLEVTSFKNQKVFYEEKAKTVLDFCSNHGIDCVIKKGTISSTVGNNKE